MAILRQGHNSLEGSKAESFCKNLSNYWSDWSGMVMVMVMVGRLIYDGEEGRLGKLF